MLSNYKQVIAYRKVKKDIQMMRGMCATFCILKVTSAFSVA